MFGLFGCAEKKENKTENVIKISVTDKVSDADIWIIPDTEENRKTTVWGTATVSTKLSDTKAKTVEITSDTKAYLIRIIDTDETYYSADEVSLYDNGSIIITEYSDTSTVVAEVYDADGELMETYELFSARL